MQTQLRKAKDRGAANWGWLDTRHSFSFANYYDPQHMGFGPLRVINEDHVVGGAGFGAHPHRDMEIITYAVDGALAHRDSSGGGGVLRHGDVQTMSAGRGVVHEEMNGSDDEPVHFLQIWLVPRSRGGEPRYAQKQFPLQQRGAVLVASPDGREGSLEVDQDVDLWRLLIDAGDSLAHRLRGRRAWVQVVTGELEVAGTTLRAGDGLAIEDAEVVDIDVREDVEALLFDLPGSTQ